MTDASFSNLHEKTLWRIQSMERIARARTGEKSTAFDLVARSMGLTPDRLDYAVRRAKAFKDDFIDRAKAAHIRMLEEARRELENEYAIATATGVDPLVLEDVANALESARLALEEQKGTAAYAKARPQAQSEKED